MNERLKELRKTLNVTQAEFADKLKLKRNTIATYEMGKAIPSDRTISDICEKFDVNEDWLRNGEGEMLIKKTRNQEIAEFMGDILKGEPDFRRRLIAVLARMTPDEWEMLERKIHEIANEP